MKQIFLIAALVVAFALPRAGRAEDAQSAAIQGVISDQFAAFVARDVTEAWRYASPMIQGMFRTPGNFGRMVENGYPMVWSPVDTQFLGQREEGGALWQRVIVQDGGGVFHVLDYRMVPVAGEWRIDGVQLVREAGVGA